LPLLAAVACTPPPPRTAPRPAAAGTYPFQSATFSSALRWENGPLVTSRFWIGPQGLLEEVTRSGKTSFVLRKGGTAYLWDAGAHEGMKGTPGPRTTGDPDTFDVLRLLPQAFQDGNFEFAGYETLQKESLPKYRFHFRDPRLRVESRGIVWLLPDRPFPVRYVNLAFGGHYEIVNSRIVLDKPPDPAFFEPPRDVEFRNVDITGK
jgi:hypothetical protein